MRGWEARRFLFQPREVHLGKVCGAQHTVCPAQAVPGSLRSAGLEGEGCRDLPGSRPGANTHDGPASAFTASITQRRDLPPGCWGSPLRLLPGLQIRGTGAALGRPPGFFRSLSAFSVERCPASLAPVKRALGMATALCVRLSLGDAVLVTADRVSALSYTGSPTSLTVNAGQGVQGALGPDSVSGKRKLMLQTSNYVLNNVYAQPIAATSQPVGPRGHPSTCLCELQLPLKVPMRL